jgi:hypothetical protein
MLQGAVSRGKGGAGRPVRRDMAGGVRPKVITPALGVILVILSKIPHILWV